jgi:hypothetical protein
MQMEITAAQQRETELREQMTALGRGAAAGTAGAKAAESAVAVKQAEVAKAEAMLTKRAADLDTQQRRIDDGARQLDVGIRKLADDRRDLEVAKKDVKSAVPVRPNATAPYGFLLWQGRVDRPTGVYINSGQANTGEVAGTLPGRRCDVRIERIGARVTTEPGPRNNWNQAAIAPEPGRLATVLFAWSCQ